MIEALPDNFPDSLSYEKMREIEKRMEASGLNFGMFLAGGAHLSAPEQSRFLEIPPQNFDPQHLLGRGWSKEERIGDPRPAVIDLTSLFLVSTLRTGEMVLPGTEWKKRIDHSIIPLDGKIFEVLISSENIIPTNWGRRIKGKPIRIIFDGTDLIRDRCKYNFVLWHENGKWCWDKIPVTSGRGDEYFTAVFSRDLVSSEK